MTAFVILTKDDSGFWSEHGTQEGHSAKDAISKSYLRNPEGGIVAMCAVPARSWKPQQIRVETTQRVVLGEPVEKQEALPVDDAEVVG